jgi:hypothetical protein
MNTLRSDILIFKEILLEGCTSVIKILRWALQIQMYLLVSTTARSGSHLAPTCMTLALAFEVTHHSYQTQAQYQKITLIPTRSISSQHLALLYLSSVYRNKPLRASAYKPGQPPCRHRHRFSFRALVSNVLSSTLLTPLPVVEHPVVPTTPNDTNRRPPTYWFGHMCAW